MEETQTTISEENNDDNEVELLIDEIERLAALVEGTGLLQSKPLLAAGIMGLIGGLIGAFLEKLLL